MDRRTEEIIPHAFYSQKRSTNDIALLRLDTPVAYTGKEIIPTTSVVAT